MLLYCILSVGFPQVWTIHQKNLNWLVRTTLTLLRPFAGNLVGNMAIRFSGLGVRSVGPICRFLRSNKRLESWISFFSVGFLCSYGLLFSKISTHGNSSYFGEIVCFLFLLPSIIQ